jgi:phage/plasmid-like protein (TIGR03299 family)
MNILRKRAVEFGAMSIGTYSASEIGLGCRIRDMGKCGSTFSVCKRYTCISSINFNRKGRVARIVANINKVATVGEAPWWAGPTEEADGSWTNLGEKDVTAKKMLKRSGSDFQVQKGRLIGEITVDGKKKTAAVPGLFALMREDTRQVLGTATERYEVFQYGEAFSFFDDVVGAGQAVYHTAGTLGIGEVGWILARLPQEIRINGSDVVENFLLLSTGHDAKHAFHMMFTPIRVVCQNTLNIATGYGQRKDGYRLSHFTGLKRRLDVKDAREALGLAKGFLKEFGEEANKMAQKAITDREIDALLQRVFPVPKRLLLAEPSNKPLVLLAEPKKEDLVNPHDMWVVTSLPRKRELVKTLIKEGKGNDDPAIAGTRWAAFNGVAEFTDYLDGWDNKRTQSLLFGDGQSAKQRAWNLLKV